MLCDTRQLPASPGQMERSQRGGRDEGAKRFRLRFGFVLLGFLFFSLCLFVLVGLIFFFYFSFVETASGKTRGYGGTER